MKLWGGRFEAGPSEAFQRFSWSLHFDKRFLDADVRGSQTFARELARAGIITAEERDRLIAAFDRIRADAQSPSFFEGADDEDVHTVVIRKLKEQVGGLADKIHTGRSRNEQVSLDARLWLRGEIDRSLDLLTGLASALLAIARRYSGAVIPGYTHTRRAQAVLWPHYILAYFEMFARDRERLLEARRRTNVFPLGSGALAGSGFPFDREAMARDLEFESITANSMDVSADRDYAMDFIYAASMVLLHLSRLAEDWILYSGEEYGWMELGDGVTSGSSLMPQKKNPDSLELIRGKAGRVFGDLSALFMTVKGLPMTYNRDLQECWEPLFDAVDQLQGSLDMARVVVETAELRPAAPAAAAEQSWVIATDLAEALARSGTPFHHAHQIAGRLVLSSVQQNKKPADWTAAELTAFAPEFQPEMIRLFHPAEGMKTREITGGTGPEHVAAALANAEARLASWRRMNKNYRQGQILKLIRSQTIFTQEDLASELKGVGVQTTQVTLSRDIRELGLVKTSEGYRQIAPQSSGPELSTILAEFLQDVRVAQNLLVLKTTPGHANTLAIALDQEEWDEVVGTLAGDDTVLLIAPDSNTAATLRGKLLGYLSE